MAAQNKKPRRRPPTTIATKWLLAGCGVILPAVIASWAFVRCSEVNRSAIKVETHNPTSRATEEAALPVDYESSWSRVDDPARDGWTIEVRSQHVQESLRQLGDLIFLGRGNAASLFASLCETDLAAGELLPSDLIVAYHSGSLRVFQSPLVARTDAAKRRVQERGQPAFSATTSPLSQQWSKASEKRYEFKIFRAIEQDGHLETHQYVAASGRLNSQMLEQHATWITHWKIDAASEKLWLRSIDLSRFEQTVVDSRQTLFTDCTQSVIGQNHCYPSQFLFGLNHWLDRNQDMRYFSPLGNPGLAIGDVNGDGLDDVYVCQEANLPNRLFLQRADGTAFEAAAAWQVDWLEGSRSALLLDLDNDGDQDLAVAILGGIVAASNEGDHFIVRDVLKTDDDTTSLAAADYDLDGDLDIYVCVDYPNDYFASAQDIPVQGGAANRIYHDSNQAGRNTLFHNEISAANGWKFVDVTQESGLDQNNRRFSWAASWEDYDNDGDQDLYVANDFGRNNLYENDGGQFRDVAASRNVEDSASSMSAAWADVNHDGRMDLYVGNMFSSAGSRISLQPAFKPGATEEIRSRLRRFARGSSLFHNLGQPGFQDVSLEAGVTLGRWAWSSNFVDINNDGWQDIVVANGYITSDDTSDL
jgi:hypothetical protein